MTETEHGQGCIDLMEEERTGHKHEWLEEEVRWCYQCNDIASGTCSRFGPHRDQRAIENIRFCKDNTCQVRQIRDGMEWIRVSDGKGERR